MLLSPALATARTASADSRQPWVGGWAAGMTAGGPSFSDQTVRMVVHSNTA
ncbi:hypothetical protein OHB00_43180 [Streptomyces sp. NBC_00631]|uniref:hypothetical protein n=1 Tax=Streptomyces sp. NBC_00631 TaxID=2975793 RepID=UPI0030DF1769